MLWHRRKALFALSALGAASACGFTPAYGPEGSASVLQDNVRVAAPNRRDGFLISQRLEERLGRNDGGRYVLKATPEIRRQELATTVEGTTNRFRLLGFASYELRDKKTDKVVRRGRVTNFTGYSATGSTVATLAAERDATARLMVIMADEIVDRLILSAAGLPA